MSGVAVRVTEAGGGPVGRPEQVTVIRLCSELRVLPVRP